MIPKTEFYVAVQTNQPKKKSWYFFLSNIQNTTFLLLESKLSEASIAELIYLSANKASVYFVTMHIDSHA